MRQRTKVKVIDNTGIKYIRIIKVIGHGSVGSIVNGTVKELISSRNRSHNNRTKTSWVRGSIIYGVLVNTSKECIRIDGIWVRSYVNSVAIINKKGEPIANRLLGVVQLNRRSIGYGKRRSLSRYRI